MPLLQQLHWLPIRLRIEFKILLITFKALKGLAPNYFIDLISVLPPSRYDLRKSNGILLSTPRRVTKVTMGDQSFMAAAPRLWDSLPVSIRSARTKSDFIQKLKTSFFSKAFGLYLGRLRSQTPPYPRVLRTRFARFFFHVRKWRNEKLARDRIR